MKSCIQTPRFSVLVNGSPQGFFEQEKGIRQGDPLSPFLFIIMAEVLGRLIQKQREQGAWKGIKITETVESLTHMQFVDDTFLGGEASVEEARVMRNTLELYGKVSGQFINWKKSEIFFFNTPYNVRFRICRILDIKLGLMPNKYLGIPFFAGRNKADLWDTLIEKCQKKMEGWRGKWLTLAGRILMLQVVITAMPVFAMMCLEIPKKVIRTLERKMRKFFWNGANEENKIPLLAWEKICRPKEEGGAGLRDWSCMNRALGAKLVWAVYENPHLYWVRILKGKYLDNMDNNRILTIRNPPKGSAIWNFMVSCREVIIKHITWQIGDGESAKFWEDSWNGLEVVGENIRDNELKSYFKERWGNTVKDYMTEKEGPVGREWCWKDVSREELTEAQKEQMIQIFKDRNVVLTKKKDKVIWCGSLSGKYSVKIGYNLLAETGRESFFSRDLCWNKDTLPKAGTFTWLAYKGRILTAERLRKIGINGPSRCPLCEKQEETIDHLLIQCQYAKKCWDIVQFKLRWQGPRAQTIREALDGWPRIAEKSTLSSIWLVAPSLIIWELWKERNRRIFRGEKESLRRCISRIINAIEETVSVSATRKQAMKIPFTRDDRQIQNTWPGIRFKSPSGALVTSRSKTKEKPVEWVTPQEGWIKVNFDGAAKGNPGVSGIGIVFKDDRGHLLLAGAKKLPYGTNNIAECQAALLAVQIARKEGIKKLHLEGDSLITVQAISKLNAKAWHLQPIINIIEQELNNFEDFKITHIKREGNQEADILSKWALSMNEEKLRIEKINSKGTLFDILNRMK